MKQYNNNIMITLNFFALQYIQVKAIISTSLVLVRVGAGVQVEAADVGITDTGGWSSDW